MKAYWTLMAGPSTTEEAVAVHWGGGIPRNVPLITAALLFLLALVILQPDWAAKLAKLLAAYLPQSFAEIWSSWTGILISLAAFWIGWEMIAGTAWALWALLRFCWRRIDKVALEATSEELRFHPSTFKRPLPWEAIKDVSLVSDLKERPGLVTVQVRARFGMWHWIMGIADGPEAHRFEREAQRRVACASPDDY